MPRGCTCAWKVFPWCLSAWVGSRPRFYSIPYQRTPVFPWHQATQYSSPASGHPYNAAGYWTAWSSPSYYWKETGWSDQKYHKSPCNSPIRGWGTLLSRSQYQSFCCKSRSAGLALLECLWAILSYSHPQLGWDARQGSFTAIRICFSACLAVFSARKRGQ